MIIIIEYFEIIILSSILFKAANKNNIDNHYHIQFNLYKVVFVIICLCNSISDKVINKAISNGANTVWQVYEACDCKPQCGSCAEYIKESIDFINKEETKDIA